MNPLQRKRMQRRSRPMLRTKFPENMPTAMREALLARLPAIEEDIQETLAERESLYADQILHNKSLNTVDEIGQKILDSRKPRMRTVEQYLCDVCDKIIDKPREGFIIHGNIYVADPNKRGGLIGNSFPENGKPFLESDVKQTVLCKNCFKRELGIEEQSRR